MCLNDLAARLGPLRDIEDSLQNIKADWQIGKPFKQFGDREAVLRQARLAAVENIGRLALREGVAHVVVAGDVYDTEAPSTRTLLEPLERMRGFGAVTWHLLPGNHDPHRPKGIWDRVRENNLPSNVRLCLTAEPVVLDEYAVLLPAPLTRKSEGGDLTQWMERAQTPSGAIRIGLAHGSVVGFGTGGEANNPIDPQRPKSAGLDYLALGDWHRTMQVGPSVWYSGTPEPDRAGSQEVGQALLVDIAGHGAPPVVVPQEVGTYRWLSREEHLTDAGELVDFETRLRALPDLSNTILRLFLKGTLPLAGRAALDRKLLELGAAFFHLEADQSALMLRPTAADLEAIDFGGVLRNVADRLTAISENEAIGLAERRQAEEALGVGKFGTRTEIIGLGAGVNILAAGNEAGKSTLFRAIRACLFERHNSRDSMLSSLATDGLSLPVTVTLGFEFAGQDYTVIKSFIKSPSASLLRGTTEIARGKEADEKIWELLGIAPNTTRSVDEAAFGILWVGQGQSFSVPEPSAAASTALNSAIQAEVGALVGGERARSVLLTLKDELGRLVTDTGRPKAGGRYAEAAARLEASEKDLAETNQRLAILDRQLVDLAARRRERIQLSDPEKVRRLSHELETARIDLKAGEGAAALLAQFEAAEQRSGAIVARAEQKLKDLQERRARIDGNLAREIELQLALTPLEAQEQQGREVISRARETVSGLDLQARRGEEQEVALQNLANAITRQTARAELNRRLSGLDELSQRLVRNTAALANNRATHAVLTGANECEREISLLTARLEAVAPQVSVELGAGGLGHVSIDGHIIAGNVTQAAMDPLTIRIGDIATLTVTPRASANGVDQKKRLDVQQKLAHFLAGSGAVDLADLRALAERRKALETESLGLQAELKAFGIQDTSPALVIERIKTDIAAIDSYIAETLAKSQLDVLPDEAEIVARQDALRQKREEARRQRQSLDGAIEAQNTRLAVLADQRGRLGGQLSEIRQALASDVAVLPDADRARLMAEASEAADLARRDYRIKAAALEEQRQKAPTPEELDRRNLRVTRLQTAIENQNTRLGTLDKEIANLEGQIQSAGGDGLGEKAEILSQESELAQRDVAKYKSRVATMLLLKSTIELCYQEQRDRLHAPLRRHLQPFLNDLFPAAELELGDGFSVSGIRRNGPNPENFADLSAGTQEQIAVLVRLAMGAMICERGQSVPIILDDALVFSDDERIEQMFDALTRAGQKQQVIVLTCRTRAFAALGGRQFLSHSFFDGRHPNATRLLFILELVMIEPCVESG
eukprot:gene17984-18220_t